MLRSMFIEKQDITSMMVAQQDKHLALFPKLYTFFFYKSITPEESNIFNLHDVPSCSETKTISTRRPLSKLDEVL